MATARVEQGYLRRRLFGHAPTAVCTLCGREFPVDLVITSHVKERSACTVDERLDVPAIVMPACRFGCDDLYERGYVAVLEDGTIAVAKGAPSGAIVEDSQQRSNHGAGLPGCQAARVTHITAWAGGNRWGLERP